MQVPWSGWGPGNRGWTPVVLSRLVSPARCCRKAFGPATHLPFAVRLQNPLSSIGSSRRLIEIMQSLTWSMNCVMSIQNTVFSGQTGHHEHRRQDVTDAINAHHGDGHHHLQAHCRCYGDRGVSLPCHYCLDVSPHYNSFLVVHVLTIRCWFHLCFIFFLRVG